MIDKKEIVARYLLEGSMALKDAFALLDGEFDNITVIFDDMFHDVERFVEWSVDDSDITLFPYTRQQYHAFHREFLKDSDEDEIKDLVEDKYGSSWEYDPQSKCRIRGSDLLVKDERNEIEIMFRFRKGENKVNLYSLIKKIF